MSTMAEVIAEHKYDHEGAVCSCSDEVQVGLRCDKQTHAEHVAAELAKAGYGNMAAAWDEGWHEGYEVGEALTTFWNRTELADARAEALRAVIEQMKLSEKWFANDVLKGYREGRYKVQHILGELQSTQPLPRSQP